MSAFALTPSNPSILYGALADGSGIFKSTDSGKNWARLEGLDQAGTVKALAVNPSDPNHVIAAGTQVFSTTRDGGKTWNHMSTFGWSSSGVLMAVAIQFSAADPNTIYFLHHAGLRKSTDAGNSWIEIGAPILSHSAPCELWTSWCSLSVLAVDPQNRNVIYSGGGNRGLWKTTNGGASWAPAIAGSSALRVASAAFNPKTPQVSYAGTNTGILKSTDGGASWSSVYDLTGYDFSALAIDPIHPETVYAGYGNRIVRSVDDGRSWNRMNTGLGSFDDIKALALSSQNPALIYAAGGSGLYEYADIGKTYYFPRFASRSPTTADPDDSEYTGIGIVNRDTADATLTFTAYDTGGNLVSGSGVTNPVVRTLKAGSQMATIDFDIWGPGLTAAQPDGWFKVDSTATRVAAFFLAFNGSLSLLDGADVRSSLFDNNPTLITSVQSDGFTRIHVANPRDEAADLQIELVDAGGAVLSKAARSVRSLGALNEELATLFPGRTTSGDHYLKIWSSFYGMPALAHMGKSGKYVQALNGQFPDLPSATLYCPQYVVGGSDWGTTLSIVNTWVIQASVALRFFRDDGLPIGSLRNLTIPPFGKVQITDRDFFMPAGAVQVQGYVQIDSLGQGAWLLGDVSFGDPARNVFGAALPLVRNLETDFIFGQVASNATWFTGIAILNPNLIAVNAKVSLLDKNGSVVGARTVTIPSRGRISRLLTERDLFPELAGRDISSGYIHVEADQGVAAFALFGPNDLSALAAVPSQSIK